MTALIRTDHAQAWRLQLHPGLSWPELLSPLVLLLSYYTLVLLGPPWVPAPAVSIYRSLDPRSSCLPIQGNKQPNFHSSQKASEHPGVGEACSR